MADEESPYVTWGELKSMMEGVSDDTRLVISKDAEGNNFSPFRRVSSGVYRPIRTWFGEFQSEPDADDDSEERDSYEQEMLDDETVTALCLWPLN